MRRSWQEFVDDIGVPKGCLGCPILVSPSSLMISESLGAVCTVESICHLCQEFVDDI
jgi:hypothetical protein